MSGRKGWTVLVLAVAWTFLPVLAGATTGGEGELWMFGSAIAGIGAYLGTIAVASVDEYRLLDRTPHVPPDRTLHKRVYWVGTAAGAMVLGGQALAFRLSAASVTAFI